MIKVEGSVSKSWLASSLDVRFDRRYYFDPWYRHQVDLRCQRHVRDTVGDLEVFYTESNLGRRGFHDDRQILVGGIQPNMIVGMLLGAHFIPADGADADITANCLANVDVCSLPDGDALLSHPVVRQFDSQIEAIAEEAAGRLSVIPPFFWDASGRAAVHGAVTSGVKFRGDQFLLEMVTEPETCQVLVDWLTEVSAVLVHHFADVAQLSIQGIHVGECAACMIDLKNFQQFVVPAASLLGRRVGPVRFHSCGSSGHIIGACRQIENIASIDVGGETSVAVIREVFGPDFPVGIAPLVSDMTAESPDGILDWLARVEEQNGGGDLTIGFHLEASYNVECLRALVKRIKLTTGR